MDVYSFNIAPQRVVLNVWFTVFRNKCEAQTRLTCNLGHKVAARCRKSGWTIQSRAVRSNAGMAPAMTRRHHQSESFFFQRSPKTWKGTKSKTATEKQGKCMQLHECSNSVPRRFRLNDLSLLSLLLTESMSTLPADPLRRFLANVRQSASQQSACISLSGSQEAWIWQL